jgi:hypothetical protein
VRDLRTPARLKLDSTKASAKPMKAGYLDVPKSNIQRWARPVSRSVKIARASRGSSALS